MLVLVAFKLVVYKKDQVKLKTSLLILLLLFPISFLKYFLKQAAEINNIIKPLNKIIFRYTENFLKFDVKQEDIVEHYFLKIWLRRISSITICCLRKVSLSIMGFYYILKSFFKFLQFKGATLKNQSKHLK